MLRGFIMTPEVAAEFFERYLMAEAITEPERVKILTDLVNEKLAATFITDKTEDEMVKELGEKANVYRVKKRKC